MNLPELLWRSTQDALLTLGEPTMQSLVWHIVNSGVSVAPKDFDIVKFAAALRDILDGGADIILSIVASNLAVELKIDIAFDPALSGVERIKEILKMAEKVER